MGSRSIKKYKRETISFKRKLYKTEIFTSSFSKSSSFFSYVATEKGHLLIKDYLRRNPVNFTNI